MKKYLRKEIVEIDGKVYEIRGYVGIGHGIDRTEQDPFLDIKNELTPQDLIN